MMSLVWWFMSFATFFEVLSTCPPPKKVANDMNHHTNDIMSFGMSSCRKKAVTG